MLDEAVQHALERRQSSSNVEAKAIPAATFDAPKELAHGFASTREGTHILNEHLRLQQEEMGERLGGHHGDLALLL